MVNKQTEQNLLVASPILQEVKNVYELWQQETA